MLTQKDIDKMTSEDIKKYGKPTAKFMPTLTKRLTDAEKKSLSSVVSSDKNIEDM